MYRRKISAHRYLNPFAAASEVIKRCLGFCQCHFIVSWIDFHERGTFIDPLVVVDVDLLDISGNASADRVKMDVYLRIVGGFEAGKIVPEESAGDGQNNERGKKYPTLVGAPLRISRSWRVICAGLSAAAFGSGGIACGGFAA